MTTTPLSCVRQAREGDREGVEALLEREDLDTDFTPETFLVAAEDDEVLGSASLTQVGEEAVELASVAVEPDRRGEGIGRALVDRSLARADGPVYALCLEPGFFEHMGFTRLDEVPAPLEPKAESVCAGRGFVPMVWRPSR